MKLVRALFTAMVSAPVMAGAQTETAPVTSATSINALGLDLYRLAAGPAEGNLLLSPYSIHAALGMTFSGAAGKTREEMAKVLHAEGRADALAGDHAALRASFEAAVADSQRRAEADKKYGGSFQPLQLRVANRLFGRDQYPFDAGFLKSMESEWRAPLETASFAADAEAARQRINGWVEDQTEKRIKDLIPSGGVDEGTRLVLVNALYFKAAWSDKFYKRNTKPLPFYAGGKTVVEVPTMYQKEKPGYAKRSGFTAVTLPYTGFQFQFLILLPDARDGLAALEKEITAAQLEKLAKLPREVEVKLYLPKFRVEPPTLALTRALEKLGMSTAFDKPAGSADFSGMAPRTPNEYVFVSQVFHKTFLALDEEGTEAAAATAVAMAAGSAPPKDPPQPVEVRVDHPFLYAIQHRETGACLFLGRVTDPR